MNPRRPTLPMRSLLLIAVALLASVPPLLGVVAWLAIGHLQHATEDRTVAAAGRYLAAGSGRWETSGWQQDATVYFRSLDVEVALTATRGAATTSDTGKPVTATVFATPGLAANGANKAALGTTMDGHQVHLPGTAQPSLAAVVFTLHPNPSTRLLGVWVAAVCGLIGTLSAILWLFGRWSSRRSVCSAGPSRRSPVATGRFGRPTRGRVRSPRSAKPWLG